MADIVECWQWVLSACPKQELVLLQVGDKSKLRFGFIHIERVRKKLSLDRTKNKSSVYIFITTTDTVVKLVTAVKLVFF